MGRAVFGLVSQEKQAQRIVDQLLSSDFLNEKISIVYPDTNKNFSEDNEDNEDDLNYDREPHFTEKNSKAPEGSAVGATTGGILGGSLGLLAGIGSLAIPGVGPFIAAGPIMAALSGSAIGGSLGLLLGGLIGAGIPEYEAKKYEEGLKSGNILISVDVDSEEELNRVREILKREGARDISTSREKTKSKF